MTGRPPKAEKDRQSEVVAVRFTPDEWREYETVVRRWNQAHGTDLQWAGFAREVLTGRIRPFEEK